MEMQENMKMKDSKKLAKIRYSKDAPIPELQWIDKIAYLMDSQFRIPGTRFRFGLDPLLGLFPLVGDTIGYTISAILVLAMARHGVSGKVIVLMIGNILVDAIVGSVPILGNIFDFFYKANNRNISLLKKHYHEGKYQGKGLNILIGVSLVLLGLLILLIYGIWKLLEYFYDLLFL